MKFEILKKYGFNQEEEIPKIFKAENGSSFFSKDYLLIVNYDELILSKKTEDGKWKFEKHSDDEILLMENFDFSENQITVNLENIIEIEQINNRLNWEFDAEKLCFPLR